MEKMEKDWLETKITMLKAVIYIRESRAEALIKKHATPEQIYKERLGLEDKYMQLRMAENLWLKTRRDTRPWKTTPSGIIAGSEAHAATGS